MFLHILNLDLGHLGPNLGDASIRNNNVQMVNALRFKLLYGVSGVSGDRGIDLDKEKRGAFGRGQMGESFGGGVIGVAIGGDNNMIWLSEIELQETSADASVGAGDQDRCRWHNVVLMKRGR